MEQTAPRPLNMAPLPDSTETIKELENLRAPVLFNRLLEMHAYPPKMIADSLGALWGGYFLWKHELGLALSAMIVVGIFGTMLALRAGRRRYSSRPMAAYFRDVVGRPLNLFAISVGYVTILVTLWSPEPVGFLVGTSFLVVGYLWGSDRLGRRARAGE